MWYNKRKKGGITVQQKYRQAFWAACGMTVLLTLWRVVIAPQSSKHSVSYGVLLVLTAVLLVALLVWCGQKREELREVYGMSATVTAAATLFTGALLIVSSVFTATRWLFLRELPYPQKDFLTATDKLFVFGLVVCGLLGGVFFVCLSAQWWKTKSVTRGHFPLMALFPIFWSWFRLLRYETSHVSAVGTYRSLLDLGVLVAEMLFLMAFARFAANVQEKPQRFLVGLSLCTGLLCTSGALTRFAMFCSQEGAAFEESALIAAPDIGFAVLAFAVAFGQAFASEPPTPKAEEVDEPDEPDKPRAPLELEDIINDILRQNH